MESNLLYNRGVYTIDDEGKRTTYTCPNEVATALSDLGVDGVTILLVITDAVNQGVCTF